MKRPDHLSRAELEAEIRRLKNNGRPANKQKQELARLRANMADWIYAISERIT